MGSTDEAF